MAGLRPCPAPRCPALTKGGPCFTHRRERQQASDRQRGTARERGYSARWDRYSRTFLRAHPLCVACEKEGRVTASAVTDHIIPHRGDERLFWLASNHAAMCKPCHDRKTATEDGGFGRAARVAGSSQVVDVSGRCDLRAEQPQVVDEHGLARD